VNYRFCGNCGHEQPKEDVDKPSVISSYISDLRAQGKIMTQGVADGNIWENSKKNYGISVLEGIIYGSVIFWIGGYTVIEFNYIPLIVFGLLFIIIAVAMACTGEVPTRKPRLIRFILSTIGSIIGWFVLGFLFLVILFS
jgi:hypothetical protein